MKELIDQLKELLKKIEQTQQALDLPQMIAEKKLLETEMNQPDFWTEREQAEKKSRQFDELNEDIQIWQGLQKETQETLDLAELYQLEEKIEDSQKQELEAKVIELQNNFAKLEFRLMLNGQHDQAGAIVSVHAGTGGVDAQDWALMLKRMLLRYCEKKNYKVTILNESQGNEAGLKSITFSVAGRLAYGYLKSESGVHRLVRISPFDAENMRHTSFALVEVLPDLGDTTEIDLKDEDLRIDVFRAGGHGGQSVNTTDSAVRIVHLPTKISVVCQNERSQHQNKATALNILKSKLVTLQEIEQQEAKQEIRGEYRDAAWGNQIRSYVLQPYKMVKDHRTKYEEADPESVLDGNLDGFVEAYLKSKI